MKKAIPVILQPGTRFFGRTAANGFIWQFTCTYNDKRLLPVPIWISSLPYDLMKVQLRSFVRLLSALPLHFRIESDVEDPQPVESITRDISGGGLQLVTKNHLPIDSTLQLSLDIPGFGTVAAKAAIVRIVQPPETNIYWIATKFTEIKETDREKIIKFIFKKQSELRQKGL